MAKSLNGKFAVVTGAGSGMGRAIATRFAAEGATVAALDVNKTSVDETVAAIEAAGGAAQAFDVNIANSASVDTAIQAVTAAFPTVDILANNAGVLDGFANLENTDEALWDRTVNIDLKGMFLVTKALLPALQKSDKPVVVNTASIAGLVAGTGGIAYTSAKHGVIGFTKQLTADYSPKLRINAVLPGVIETSMTRELLQAKDTELMAQISSVPAKRFAQPEEVANVVFFLASDESSFMYGSQVVVDGGWTIV